MSQNDFNHATPVYEYLEGWTEDITGARTFDDLPATAQAYVRRLEVLSGAPFASIGVGPDREQTLELRSLLP
ncbi:MAG: purA [Frankiales bacterium]|nr:purA [Frankiales bacterium]